MKQELVEIIIKNLKAKAIIGILPKERVDEQELLIDLKIKFDAKRSIQSDNISDTVDYFNLSEMIKNEVESSKFQLIEKLSDHLLNLIKKDNKIKECKLTIHKPEALKEFGAIVSISSGFSSNPSI